MKKICLITFLFCSLYGFSQSEIINSNASWPVGLAEKNDVLYIAEGNINEITTINLNDPNLTKETYISQLGRPIYLDIIEDFLYFNHFNLGNISRIDLTQNSPNPEVIVSGLNTTSDFIVDGTIIFYTKPSGIYKLDMAATDPISTVVIEGQNSPKQLFKHGDYLYYSELWENRISKINLLETSPIPEIIISDIVKPTGLVIHDNELIFGQEGGNLEILKIDLISTTQVITTIDSGITCGDLLFIDDDLYATSIVDGLVVKYNDLFTVSSTEVNNQDFNIYPNPTIDYLYFEQDQNHPIKKISIFDISGILVYPSKYSYENGRLNLSQLSSGVYFIKAFGDNWMKKKKIIRL